jgi:hypothetical protein
MSMSLDRRLQLLIDEGRYRRLAARARERETSVAAVIRDAIDAVLPEDLEGKRAAWKRIEEAPPLDLPATVEELKQEIEDAHARGR